MILPRISALLFCCALAGAVNSPDERAITNARTLASQPLPGAQPIPIDDLFYTRSVSGPSWSPDGREIAFTTTLTGRPNVWKVSSESGWPIQLSQSDDRELAAEWSPDGKWIVYQQDRGGAETYDLYAVPAAGGEVVNLTKTPDISETEARWSPDSSTLAFGSKRKTSSITDLAVLDWKTRTVRLLTHEKDQTQSWMPITWSRDGKYLYAMRADTGYNNSDVYRVECAGGQAENLTPHQGNRRYLLGDVSPDGSTALISSNEKEGFANVALLDITTKKLSWVTNLRWDTSPGEFSPDGKHFTYIVNEDGRTSLFLVDRAAMHAEKLDFPEGVSSFAGTPSAFSPSGDRLLISHQDSQRPSDFWVYDLAARSAKQITFSAIADLNPDRLPAAHLVHYRSFDGKIISAFLWMPFNLKRDGLNPGVVLPHGGPTGQTVDSFDRTAAALASRGYVCIAPNPRGSTGYGLAFQKANYQDLGGGDLQDEVYAAKFLSATGYVDAKRIGMTGGSYGGYMTLMAIGKTPDVWAAAVEEYGIIDWLTMLQHEDPRLQEYEKSILGDPAKDQKIFQQDSPINFIRNAKAPLLVLQGDNDVRVPKEEAQQVVSILDKAGKTVDAHYYSNEGHGFVKRENQIDAIRRTIDWFDKYLKQKPG